jgi:enoyl-CoA hydratase/carnithine racemase
VNEIEVIRTGAVMSIQLNRPEKKNAINKGMYMAKQLRILEFAQ